MNSERSLVFVDDQTKFDELQVPYDVIHRDSNEIVTKEFTYIKIMREDICKTDMNVEHMLWHCRGYPSHEEIGKMYRWWP